MSAPRSHQRGFFTLPAGMAVLRPSEAGGPGGECPDYSTVTLRLTADAYTPPDGDAAALQFLACPYTPPTVE